jgi:hypothetical protein
MNYRGQIRWKENDISVTLTGKMQEGIMQQYEEEKDVEIEED